MKIKIVLMMAMLALTLFIVGCSDNDVTTNAVVEGEVVKIPLDQISRTLQKFEYDVDGTTVRYMVVLGTDGQVRTAFDACDVCGGAKGYTQQGNDIKCNNCGRVFSINGLGTQNKGYGCWPSYLSHTIENNYININIDEIKQGAYRFS